MTEQLKTQMAEQRAHDKNQHIEVVRLLEEDSNFKMLREEAIGALREEGKRDGFVNNPQRLVVGAGSLGDTVRFVANRIKRG